MPIITLPDNSQRSYPEPVSVAQLARDIGAGLAKSALAGKVDGRLVDLSFVVVQDAQLSIITDRDPEGLEVLRHSTAHLLAQAVKRLYPEAQVTIGPVIEDGFYYDFAYHRPFTTQDLAAIEQAMQAIVTEDLPVVRSLMSRAEAVTFFQQQGETYKAEIISSIPSDEALSLYRQGEFIDLCRGPHVPSTGKIRAFKLMKVAGAYWRGDAKNAMLQRIYGTAWADSKALKGYLYRLEEAEKRDHRRLGRALNLFHFQDEAPGMVFWHPKGWLIWQTIEHYMRELLRQHGYQEIRTPQVMARVLWELSGHWQNYAANMFITESESHDFAVKPMHCPGHVQVFYPGLRRFRELPLRLAEFGACHRNEPSGSLHGLLRVRGFTQDDAHIFCTDAQVLSEVSQFVQLVHQVYADFGFTEVLIALSTRPTQRIGDDTLWDRAEGVLADALQVNGLSYRLQPGEGAFYGPKIEFTLKDSLGRLWQCGTVQLDYSLPARLGAEYVAEDNSRKTPVMLHRAILGSFERFIGMLIEHYSGLLPLWLAPVQVVVLTITNVQDEYAQEVTVALHSVGIRVESDLRNEKIGYKIREHTLLRVPYMIILGEREQAERLVSVRTRSGLNLGSLVLAELIARLQAEICAKHTAGAAT